MKIVYVLVFAAMMVVLAASASLCDSSGRIYGKITTVDGDVYEGLVRWDKNEASWCDMLNGNKDLDDGRHRQRRDKHTRIKVFGIPIGERLSTGDLGSAQSGILFGNIEKLEVLDDAVRLTLKSGARVILSGGSSDIGGSIRGIVVEDRKEGEIELDWKDVEQVEFSQADPTLKSNFGERLYGTLTTRRGDEYTGWVSWDADELFTNDVLDGEHRNHRRKIELARIKSIERHGSDGAAITLANGDKLVLEGTNDVDDGNRGIAIYDPGFGSVTVDWDEFDRLEFKPPQARISYDDFDGGRPLSGTVYTEKGEKYTGTIRWDDDEEHTWEILDGNCRGAEFDVPFAAIREIKTRGVGAAVVTTWDGRSFRLSGTNDVNSDNKGIFIRANGATEVEVDWGELDRVEFAK
jgi:hypothetical protein